MSALSSVGTGVLCLAGSLAVGLLLGNGMIAVTERATGSEFSASYVETEEPERLRGVTPLDSGFLAVDGSSVQVTEGSPILLRVLSVPEDPLYPDRGWSWVIVGEEDDLRALLQASEAAAREERRRKVAETLLGQERYQNSLLRKELESFKKGGANEAVAPNDSE